MPTLGDAGLDIVGQCSDVRQRKLRPSPSVAIQLLGYELWQYDLFGPLKRTQDAVAFKRHHPPSGFSEAAQNDTRRAARRLCLATDYSAILAILHDQWSDHARDGRDNRAEDDERSILP
jgi:hypothetical protein